MFNNDEEMDDITLCTGVHLLCAGLGLHGAAGHLGAPAGGREQGGRRQLRLPPQQQHHHRPSQALRAAQSQGSVVELSTNLREVSPYLRGFEVSYDHCVSAPISHQLSGLDNDNILFSAAL